MEQVYHVVTERPMKLGQKIIFDGNNHNGVYNRVTTFQKIMDGETVNGEIADLIMSDLNDWGEVAYRELAIEKVRIEEYPDYPSRMACLYTSRTFDAAKSWAEYFDKIGRKVFSIVKLSVEGNVFDGDACNCFDGIGTDEDIEKARLYWQCAKTERPIIETLVDGIITVEELWEWDEIKKYSDYSRKISERMWNLPDKGECESHREETFIDDVVQKSHIERELLANLEGIETVFDGGAGCGRFSILLAKMGCKVTHFDISQPMLDKAEELAKEAGVEKNITFVKGALEDLSAYPDNSFDLVMSFDAPISYPYPNQEKVIRDLVRMAKKKVMFSVSSRLGSLPYLSNPLSKQQFILNRECDDEWVQWCIANRQNAIDRFSFDKGKIEKLMQTGLMGGSEEIEEYEKGGTPWCITYTFMPDELKTLLEKCGVKNIELAGPGAFARTIPNEILVKIMNNEKEREDFLAVCHAYDSNPYVCGMGKDNLFVKGDI